ncbi:hypothetical protein GCM10010981_23310 [Dyella nitratireducens]|uniref:Uncharacterized protein n=1 Tax=Dyella nitratireducens TaxID=1849580 RepID=A0ABQ1G1I5_9GAMM|nr:hypothetical protein GCM10010981_23310 [Dyella nitratireducens]GLQ40765.1 hypothetical protein GCM10007902_06150 [Dyella nitratireducens]
MRIRAIFLILFVAFLSACTTVDGEYVQTEGAKIDYQKVDKLTKGVSTISETVTALGEPSRRYVGAGDVDVLEYVSVKTRESYEKTLGFIHDKETQSLRETLTLTFEHGVLSSKEEKSAKE